MTVTRIALDCEFNEFGGELRSIALVAENMQEVYYELLPTEEDKPWYAEHVAPLMSGKTTARFLAGEGVGEFISRFRKPVIIADWPCDFRHLCDLLVFGSGVKHESGDFTMAYMKLPAFSSAESSLIPHHALHDARALMNYLQETTIGL